MNEYSNERGLPDDRGLACCETPLINESAEIMKRQSNNTRRERMR